MNAKELLKRYADGQRDFRSINLHRAHLDGADLRGARLAKADLSGASLGGTDLSGADLTGADLDDTDLTGANLWLADLRYADLCYTELYRANLSGANLTGTVLNWYSHDLISAILLAAAKADVGKRKIASLILVSRDWCWDDFLRIRDPNRAWALDVLASYVQDGDNAPDVLRRRAARLAHQEKR